MAKLYKKNDAVVLDPSLFQHPTNEYRSFPFWSWNGKLDKAQLDRQIEYFEQMGFGGFQMHSRTGLQDEYLGETFMDCVKHCTARAKEKSMLAWLYDEDRWPSGIAGGVVTKMHPEYRNRQMRLTVDEDSGAIEDVEKAIREGLTYYITAYDIQLDDDGYLKDYRRIGRKDAATLGQKWYLFSVPGQGGGWSNGAAYVDTMNKEAVDEFIRVTHDKYYEAVGTEFDKCVPAIFFDEPFRSEFDQRNHAKGTEAVQVSWTPKLPEGFKAAYGYDMLDCLPEVFWDLPDGKYALVRSNFLEYTSQLFYDAFTNNIATWCRNHNIICTGHFLIEEQLNWQVHYYGDLMRQYACMDIPGMDALGVGFAMLPGSMLRSVLHQYGKEAALCELYGVTNWDFDFRGYKYQGDWLEAAGVNVRIQHLSYMTMEGDAKRDYPPSINYQAPWYKEYSILEDYYARLNTVLSRGKAVQKFALIMPTESAWLHYGPKDQDNEKISELSVLWYNEFDWTERNQYSTDFIDEILLKDLWDEKNPRAVGQIEYDTIMVSAAMETMRSTTLKALEGFQKAGGKVIFDGYCPQLVDARPSKAVEPLYERSIVVPFHSKAELLEALAEDSPVRIKDSNGNNLENLIYNLREDTDCDWLFIAQMDHNTNPPLAIWGQHATVTMKGQFHVEEYDALSGTVKPISYEIKDGKTYIHKLIYPHDSLLLRAVPTTDAGVYPLEGENEGEVVDQIFFHDPMPYTMDEPNVALLDMAEYHVDDEPWLRSDECLNIHDKLDARFGYPNDGTQPWAMPPQPTPEHTLSLRYTIESDIDVPDAAVAFENLEDNEITLNGQPVVVKVDGYYIDESFHKMALPLKKGVNVLELKKPFGTRTTVEAGYLLGDFGVKLKGSHFTIIPRETTIGFENLVMQGMPFYGGTIEYHAPVELDAPADLRIQINCYCGAMIRVFLDGEDKGTIIFGPYQLTMKDVSAGKHTITFRLYGNRYNTLAAIHNVNLQGWSGEPSRFRDGLPLRTCGYNLVPFGIVHPPIIDVLHK